MTGKPKNQNGVKYMKSTSQIFHRCLFTLICTGLLVVALPVNASPAGQDDYIITEKTMAKIAELKQQLANNPNNPLLYYKTGELYLDLHRWQDSLAAFGQAVRIKADFAAAHYSLGWAHSNLSKFEEALEAHKRALVLADTEQFGLKITKAQAQYAVAWDYYSLKRYEEAISAYQDTLKLDPRFEDALYEIGRVHIAQGSVDQAQQTVARLSNPYKEWLLKEISHAT